mgnify:FL=1
MFEPDWDLVAKALGVSRETLPNTKSSITAVEKPAPSRAVDALSLPAPLTDDEWEAILPHLPAAHRKKGRGSEPGDRAFINACLWYAVVSPLGYGWRLLPSKFPNRYTCESRHFRWWSAGVFQAVYLAVKHDERLASNRLSLFRWLADDGQRRLDEQRKRLDAAIDQVSGHGE